MSKLILGLIIAISAAACAQPPKQVFGYFCGPCNSACDTIIHEAAGRCEHCRMELVASTREDIAKIKTAYGKALNVAIFIHEGVELLDFAGPGEVFASSPGFNVFTVAASVEPIVCQGFVKITPQFTIANCPRPDVIVLPGGATNIPMGNKDVIDWLRNAVPKTQVTLSVCTGAGLLSKAGQLDGKTVTTFHNYIDALQEITPKAKVIRNTRFVDNGLIITTAGVSAGIDGALHVVSKIKGLAAAKATAEYMEYDKWKPEEGLIITTSNN
jgi:transcriptional regulator GlxA family with amidase domain